METLRGLSYQLQMSIWHVREHRLLWFESVSSHYFVKLKCTDEPKMRPTPLDLALYVRHTLFITPPFFVQQTLRGYRHGLILHTSSPSFDLLPKEPKTRCIGRYLTNSNEHCFSCFLLPSSFDLAIRMRYVFFFALWFCFNDGLMKLFRKDSDSTTRSQVLAAIM